MRNAGGWLIGTNPNGRIDECDTYSCKHCNKIVFVKPKQDPADIGGLCKQCMGLICPTCLGHGHCHPLEKKLEESEARYHALRSYGLA